jgi:hypothetical protein
MKPIATMYLLDFSKPFCLNMLGRLLGRLVGWAGGREALVDGLCR